MARRTRGGEITLEDLLAVIPGEDAAREWFEGIIWPDGRTCLRCGSARTSEVPGGKPMPYWCTDCRNYFSVKTGTVMQSSKLPLRKWAITICLMTPDPKGVSSIRLGRDLGIAQKNAWYMMRRIKQAPRSDDRMFRALSKRVRLKVAEARLAGGAGRSP